MGRTRGNLALLILGITFSAIGILEYGGLLVACVVCLVQGGPLPPVPVFLFLLLHGGIFGGVGLGALSARARGARKKARLMAEGVPVLAHIVEIKRDYSVRVNRQYAWRVICELEEGGTVYRFRSDRLWEYPELNNEYVAVYRDPANPRCYYVDVEGSCRPVVEL